MPKPDIRIACKSSTFFKTYPRIASRGRRAESGDGELTELRWQGKTYAEGSKISLNGSMLKSFHDLPTWTDYFIPAGCPHFKRAMLVDHLPE